MITVSQLPESTRNTFTEKEGPESLSAMAGAFLRCEACGSEYSATRGDYFQCPPDMVLECGHCDHPLELVKKHRVFEKLTNPERT